MTERSLTPSPHRTQNLERGVFSSLSALSLYKQTVEERKQIQSSSTIVAKKSPLHKPRSPVRMRPVVKKVEKSPEPQTRSPLKMQNRGREEIEPRSNIEIEKLHETIKTLKNQIERDKRIYLRLDGELKDAKNALKAECEKNEKIQKSLQTAVSSNSLLVAENEKLGEELKKNKAAFEDAKEHLKNLGTILVSILSSYFLNYEEDTSLIGKEKTRVVCRIKELVYEKLQEIINSTNVDLARQVSEVRGWLIAKNFPKQTEKLKVKKEEVPDICYTVEYFDEDKGLGSTNEYLNTGESQKMYTEEVSFNEPKNAVALYDFEGEREEDLAFFSGDTIEILEECESGWWIGRLHGKTGCFPYNFVQLI